MYFRMQKSRKVMVGPIESSEQEIKDILKAWVAISFAFAIAFTGLSFSVGFLYIMLVSAITVGLGFLLHELAHKIVAQRYGCFAEFRAFDQMLFLMILMSFLGFLFAAPGAVMISGPVGKRRNGVISIAGPVTNLVLAVLFLGAYFLVSLPFLQIVWVYGFIINTWLALFNMIPFWMFDGAKIWKWSKPAWWSVVIIGFVFLMVQAVVPGLSLT